MSNKASQDMQEDNLSNEAENIAADEELMNEDGSDLMNDVLDAINEQSESEGTENELSEDGAGQADNSQAQEIERLKQELAAAQDKYVRALADTENLKKRHLKERSELLKYQGEQIVQDLLRVVDDLDLALQFSGQDSEAADPQKFIEGVRMIHKNFVDTFAKWQIRAESAVGLPFDPQKQMAISKVVVPDATPGTVISELKKVYFYKDKILRVGEVIVAAEPETN